MCFCGSGASNFKARHKRANKENQQRRTENQYTAAPEQKKSWYKKMQQTSKSCLVLYL